MVVRALRELAEGSRSGGVSLLLLRIPRSYTHIALTPARRLDVAWSGEGVSIYDKLRRDAQEKGLALPDYVKRVLRRFVESE
jgi:hypothetical protein